MADQPGYTYSECPECGFDSVLTDKVADGASRACPLCAGDSGHDVRMRQRVASDADKPEGRDMRPAPNGTEASDG